MRWSILIISLMLCTAAWSRPTSQILLEVESFGDSTKRVDSYIDRVSTECSENRCFVVHVLMVWQDSKPKEMTVSLVAVDLVLDQFRILRIDEFQPGKNGKLELRRSRGTMDDPAMGQTAPIGELPRLRAIAQILKKHMPELDRNSVH